MSDRITPKAHDALALIAAGKYLTVSRQMIDRLYARGFVDFAVECDGWHLTDEGLDALWSL